MASIGHVAVGMTAARAYHGRVPHASALAFWSALSLLPDVDVAGFALGVNYADAWGHRGATHSLMVAAAVGVGVGLAARRFGRPFARTAVFATVVLASHALLDTMTDGGLGCALLWPFDLTRYFAPWRPIPVAPIGVAFFSPDGASVALAELVLFCPAFLFALRPRRTLTWPVGVFLAVWLGGVFLLSYNESTRDSVIGFLLREDTAYTTTFSETAFQAVQAGQSEREVRALLGPPFREFWFYTPQDSRPPDERPSPSADRCSIVSFEGGAVATLHGLEPCGRLGLRIGMSSAQVDRQLGSPTQSCWQYSWSPGAAHHRERLVCFSGTTVATIVRKWS